MFRDCYTGESGPGSCVTYHKLFCKLKKKIFILQEKNIDDVERK